MSDFTIAVFLGVVIATGLPVFGATILEAHEVKGAPSMIAITGWLIFVLLPASLIFSILSYAIYMR